MNKTEMVYEIISHTTFSGLSQRMVDDKIKRTPKEEIERLYLAFKDGGNADILIMAWFRC